MIGDFRNKFSFKRNQWRTINVCQNRQVKFRTNATGENKKNFGALNNAS